MRDSALASVLFSHYAAVERGEQYVIAIKKAVEAFCFYCFACPILDCPVTLAEDWLCCAILKNAVDVHVRRADHEVHVRNTAVHAALF